MNILENILQHKKVEVEKNKGLYPVRLLEDSIYYKTQPVSLKEYLNRKDKIGVIAEIKRRSPSKGVINNYISVERTSIGYMQSGASALSIITDKEFFGGSNEDLMQARKFNYCPILRKDFIIDEYQIIESKSIGADVVLLIASSLSPKRIRELAAFAKTLKLEVLLETVSEKEIKDNLSEHIDLIGINNRNLEDFSVNPELSFQLGKFIPDEFVKVSESALKKPEHIMQLKSIGFKGFLIGTSFLKYSRPEVACAELIKNVHELMLNEKITTE